MFGKEVIKMADSFHFSVNIISRGKGKSAVASAAYISGEKIKNEWDGVTHDYTKKQGVISKEIYLPDHAPKEYKDRKTLWNSVELFEKNSNAQLARNFIISLPKELSIEENKKMIEEYVQNNFVKEGMIVDLAIHDESREGNQNIHAHIMTIVRPINEDGTWGQKSKKEYILDEQLQDYLRQLSKSNDETILELEEFAKNNHIPIVEPEVRQLLKMILLTEQPKSILEIGTAIGYSSIVMKKTCPAAKITTVENYEKNANFARENFEKYGYDDIELIFGDGYEVMKNMDTKFDLIFIDAAKGQYIKYFEEAVRLSNKNSVIVCDNVLFRGMVCEKEFYEHRHRKITIVKRLREFLEIISDSSKYDTTIIPIDDGMSITKLK